MTIVLGILAFAGGFALCWFVKDTVVVEFTSASALATKLEAKAKALRAVL